MVIFIVRAVVFQGADFFGEFFIVGYNRAGVTERAEVLSRVKAVACGVAEGACGFALVGRAVSLGAVLDDFQVVLFRKLGNPVHPASLTVEVDRHNRLCPRGYRGFDFVGIDVEGFKLRVNKHRRRACVAYRENRGNEGICRHDYLVVSADTERLERHNQSVESVADSDAVFCADVLSKSLLKGFVLGSVYIPRAFEHTLKRRLEFFF